MRRIALSLVILSAAALTACSGGGSVLNFGSGDTPDRVIVTVQGPSNIARVLPGSGLPISALAVRGSQNGTLSNNAFHWSAALVASGTYVANTLGQTKPCGVVNVTAGGLTVPYLTDFGIYIAIDPTNESNIIFIPPVTIPAPTATTLTPPGASPYCVVVSATAFPGGATGSITVAVVNPAAPTQ